MIEDRRVLPSEPTIPAGIANDEDGMDALRMDRFSAARRLDIPASMLAKLRVKLLGTCAGHSVWAVDGSAVRSIDIDFTDGGNPARYTYVPEGDIWIEQRMTGDIGDFAAVCLHERIEIDVMMGGASYEDAHEASSAMERIFRQAWASGAVSARSLEEAFPIVEEWFAGMVSAAKGLVAG